MFEKIITELENVKRFDEVTSSKNLEFGVIQDRLAMQVNDKPMIVNQRAQRQLLSNWKVPGDHFDRLPVQLQVAELEHFSRKAPKELTVRAIDEGIAPYPVARAVASGRYTPYDNAELLRDVREHLEGYEVTRCDVDNDQMIIQATRPEEYDVSPAKVGDIVKVGLTIGNSEVKTLTALAEMSTNRLWCLNGCSFKQNEISVKQKHIHINREMFAVRMETAVAMVRKHGEKVVMQMRGSHQVLLPNLDPDEGKAQKAVIKVLRAGGLWNKSFREEAERDMKNGTLFGLVQFMTDGFAKRRRDPVERFRIERTAGALLEQIAA